VAHLLTASKERKRKKPGSNAALRVSHQLGGFLTLLASCSIAQMEGCGVVTENRNLDSKINSNKKHSGLECPKLVSADRPLCFLLLNWVKIPVLRCQISFL